MTGSANCDIVSKGRRDLCGVKCIGVTKIGLKAETIVIPDESACGGRDPVSSNEWFCWILRRRRTERLPE